MISLTISGETMRDSGDNNYMAEIRLSNGMRVLVDEEDMHLFDGKTWTPQQAKANKWYAARNDRYPDGRLKKVYLHRVIANAPKGRQVDHINGNGLDNRRANLRVCTNAQNMWNVARGRGLSRFKGVSWQKRLKQWRAYIVIDARQRHLGYFDTEDAAARAYDTAARALFGEFARCNFDHAA